MPLILILILIFNINCFGTPWDVSTAFGGYKKVSQQDTAPWGLFFNPDGTKMYFTGNTNRSVYQFSLSTAWDVSTATWSGAKDVSSEDTVPLDIFFNPDGTKMYMSGSENSTVYQYTLDLAWNVNFATYDNKYKDVSLQDTTPFGNFFSPDGTKMYITGGNTSTVYQYSLFTAWDVSTATYSKSKDISSQDNIPHGIFFSPDGSKMYIMGDINMTIYQYSVSIAWDVSTATYDNKSKDISSEDGAPYGLFFNTDGSKMYFMGYNNKTVYQYVLPFGVGFKWNGVILTSINGE